VDLLERGCCVRLESLVSDPSAARGPLRTSPQRVGNKAAISIFAMAMCSRSASGSTVATRGAALGPEFSSIRILRPVCGAVTARTLIPSRLIRSGKAEMPNMLTFYAAAVPAGMPTRSTTCHSRRTETVSWGRGARRVIGVGASADADLGNCVQALVGNPELVPSPILKLSRPSEGLQAAVSDAARPQTGCPARDCEAVANSAQGFESRACCGRVGGQRARDAQAHDFASLPKLCGVLFGWPAIKTLEVAQVVLYDGRGRRSSPPLAPRCAICRRGRTRHASDRSQTAVAQSVITIPVPEPPVIRTGAEAVVF